MRDFGQLIHGEQRSTTPLKKCKTCEHYTEAQGRWHEYCWHHNRNWPSTPYFKKYYGKKCDGWQLSKKLDEILGIIEPVSRWDR